MLAEQSPPRVANKGLYCEQVHQSHELQKFVTYYADVSGNTLTESYLNKAIVYQFYKNGEPVAGYVFNTIEHNRLRYFSYLDELVQEQLLLEEELDMHDILEITGNWKSKELTIIETMVYYFKMLEQAAYHAKQFNKHVLLGGSVIKPVKKIQLMLMSRVIYHGPINKQYQAEVNKQTPLLKLYVTPLTNIRLRTIIVLLRLFALKSRKSLPLKPRRS